MINSAIDYFRRNEKHYHAMDISYAQYESTTEVVLDQIAEHEIVNAIQRLAPSYRIVFNLYVVEGFRHEEIAAMLNISVGTSKSNLAIARSKMKKILLAEQVKMAHERNG